MKSVNAGAVLDGGRWSPYLKGLVALTALTIAVDGVDNQLLGIAVPALMKEWSLPRGAFAPLLAAGMFGMVLGGTGAGLLGDRAGRKSALISCVLLFAGATLAASLVHGVALLGAFRFLAGIGLGGAMPNAATLAAEYVPARRRPLAVTLTIVCVPVGGLIAAYLGGKILPVFGWRALFVIGGVLPLVLAAALAALLPESPRYLARYPARWPELVRFLTRAGHPVPAGANFSEGADAIVARPSVRELFTPYFRRDTLALWGAFFSCLLAVYLGFNWIVSMLTGAGLSFGTASAGLMYFNLGGVAGALGGSLVIPWLGSRMTILGLCAGAIVAAGVLALMPISAHADPLPILVVLTVAGLFINAVQTSIYALATHIYPSSVRVTGVGSAMSFGRFGGLLSTYAGAGALEFGGTRGYFILVAVAMTGAFISLAFVRQHLRGSAFAVGGATEGRRETSLRVDVAHPSQAQS